jgi:gliding motility-associated-like protein
MRSILTLILILAINLSSAWSQINVTVNQSATQLANNMVGPGIAVSNATLNCPARASGIFTWTNSSVGLTRGVVLSTGDADSITTNGGFGLSTGWGAPGDIDLNAAIASPGWPQPPPTSTEDACVLEFDLIPNCDTIAINYTFASSEYNGFVNTQFNDAFAFFISGPGIVGVQNIALVPNTNIPITINSVNNGPAGAGPCTNCAYFLDNSANPPADPAMEFTGFTQKMVAKQIAVPCATYHIKFVIADGSDDILDSGVFLEQGGFLCLGAQVNATASTNGQPGNDLYAVRGCVDAVFTISRSGDTTIPANITYQLAGSAISGTDFNPLPGTISFNPNESQVQFTVPFLPNGGMNGLDSLMIIVSNNVCGNITSDTAKIYILDPPNVQLGADTIICPGSAINIGVAAETSRTYAWSPGAQLSSTNIANPRFTPLTSGIYPYQLQISDNFGCSDRDTIVITVTDMPPVDFIMPDTGCLLEDITLVYDTTQVPGDIFFWDFDLGEFRSGNAGGPIQVKWHYTGVKNVTLFIRRNGCNTDTVTKWIEILPLPENSFTYQNPICWGKEDTLVFTGSTLDGTIYNWGIDGGQFTSPNPFTDTIVTVMWDTPGTKNVSLWLDQHGCLSDSIAYQVIQHPTLDGYIENDTLICSGDTNYVELNIFGGDGGPYQYSWSPTNAINDPTLSVPAVFPSATTTYLVLASDVCGQELQFEHIVNVHPLPNLPSVFHDTVCQGERALLKAFSDPDSFFVHWYNYRSRAEQKFPIFTGTHFPAPPVNQSTIFYVDVEDTFRCRSPRVPVFVYVNVLPTIDFEAMPETMELPGAITTLLPEIESQAGIASIYWSLGDGYISIDSMPVQQYFTEGQYDITLTVVDSNGCVSTITKEKYLKVEKPLIMNIPNAFSPNGDGINDFFQLSHLYLQSLKIIIFDRWGNQVFESINPDFRWDGSLQGNPLPEGVYVYEVTGFDKEGIEIYRKGSITLIR